MKKVSTDATHTTFRNEKGHEIRIGHAGLSPSHLKQMQALPLYGADGITDEDLPPPTPTPAPSPTPPPADTQPPAPTALPAPDPGSPSATGEAGDEADEAIPGAGSPVNPGTPGQSEGLTGLATPGIAGVAEAKKGIQEQQDVDSRLAEANAVTGQNHLKSQQDLLQKTNDNIQQLSDYRQKFIKDFGDGHIDPKHYQGSMQAPQKVASAIGLILGGLSSGLTGQGNPALEFLNKQIDRDIESQKAGMNNKLNLYHANLAYFKDQQVALNETRAQMNDIYATKLRTSAEALGTPAAKAKADQAIGQLDIQTSGLQQQDAIRKSVMEQLRINDGEGVTPIALGHAGLIPAEAVQKEQASIDSQRKAIDLATNIAQQLNKEQTFNNLRNPQSYARVGALKAQFVQSILNMSPSHRLTKESVEAEVNPLFTRTWHTKETAKTNLDGMLNLIAGHAEPTPFTQHIAPRALPLYPYQTANTPQVGSVVTHASGKREQITDQTGSRKPLRGR